VFECAILFRISVWLFANGDYAIGGLQLAFSAFWLLARPLAPLPSRFARVTFEAVTPRWMRIAYVVFGVTLIATGISWLVKGDGNSASGEIQIALGVGWLLLAAFKGRRSASHPNLSEAPEPGRHER